MKTSSQILEKGIDGDYQSCLKAQLSPLTDLIYGCRMIQTTLFNLETLICQ